MWHAGYGSEKGYGMQGTVLRKEYHARYSGVACGVWWHDMQGTVVTRVASFPGSPSDVAVQGKKGNEAMRRVQWDWHWVLARALEVSLFL